MNVMRENYVANNKRFCILLIFNFIGDTRAKFESHPENLLTIAGIELATLGLRVKKKHQRQSISLETKIAILDRLGKGEGSTAIGKHLNLGESTVRAIKKNEAAIRKSVISGTKLSTKFASYTRDVLLERTERAIAIWIEEQVQRRIPGECATADEGAAKIFPEKLAKIIEDGDYSADQVFNADETGHYWKRLPNRTYIAKDEKTERGHKESKDRVTLLLCSNASGDRMLKPLLINKSLRPRALKDGVVGLEGDNDEEEKSTLLTGKLIHEGLQLCSKLENHFLINDPNSERASKLQRELQNCMSGYRELYKKIKESSSQSLITDYIVRKGRATQNENEVYENPWPLPQISIAERVSSDDGDLEPLRKRCNHYQIAIMIKNAVNPKCLGGPPVDRDRRNVHPRFR
ncbi:tigger transposable element-derived protein 1 [Trichonephila clavipes]|nr:tigger transposable element-derived protein 1 [Trichonephila clavipes]